MPGTLFVVATPIGNLEDITLRALRVLREVAVVAAEDTRRTAHLLARHAIATSMTSLHEHNEGSKSASIVDRLQRGEDVALVSDAGTPTVSDPGARLIRLAIESGVRVEPIPGPSAVLAALAASGLASDAFTFLGFPPIRSKHRKQWFARLADVGGVVVFFEAPHRIRRTLETLRETVGDCEVAVARELTKIHEELVRGQISSILSTALVSRGEFTVVAIIGHKTEINIDREVSPGSLLDEIGEMTQNNGTSKRRAITALAKRHGLPPNDVYDIVELAKKSIK
jgi:16S rRNA (cytidine1402-2'-O)-methyltransferase